MLKPNSLLVYNFVKAATEARTSITAADIAEGTGLEVRSVNGCVTSAFQKKGLMERIPAEVEIIDTEGNVSHKTVKLIRLTEAGLAFDPTAEEE
jgi:hypothetical protein